MRGERVCHVLAGMIGVVGAMFGDIALEDAKAQANSWTNSVGGKWEAGANWSLGTPPGQTNSVFLTNALTKVVTIDDVTTNTPAALTITNLTVSAPVGATNILAITNSGVATPLRLLNHLTITAGGALTVTNGAVFGGVGALTVDGTLRLVDGTVTWTNGSAPFTLGSAAGTTGIVWVTGGQFVAGSVGNNGTIGSSGIGHLIVSNGNVRATVFSLRIGNGTLTVAGGAVDLLAGNLTFLGATATVVVTGGRLGATNAASGILQTITTQPTHSQQLFISGTATVQVRVAQFIPGGGSGAGPTLTMNGGYFETLTTFQLQGQTNTPAAFWLSGGQFIATNGATTLGGVGGNAANMTMSNGLARVQRFIIGGGGNYTQLGGTNQLVSTSDFELGLGNNRTSTVWIAGGELVVTNSFRGILDVLGGGASPGDSSFTISNGTVRTREFYVGASAGNRATLTMVGGTLLLSSNLTLGANLLGGSGHSTGTVWLTGGQLLATQSLVHVGLHSNSLTRLTISNGTLRAARLLATNGPAGPVTFVGGTISSGATTLYTGQMFDVGDGSSAAIFEALTGVHNFSNNLHIANNATLTGCGTIVGNVLNEGTIISTCAGPMTFTGVVTNNGTINTAAGATIWFTNLVVNNGTIIGTNGFAKFTGHVTNNGTMLLNPDDDSDVDGIPNSWEQTYGFDPFDPADASQDSDGDGFTNLQEYLAGTNPTNSASAFRITAIARVASTNILVTWRMGSGKTNALQATGGAAGSYSTNNFTDIFTVTNTVGTVTNYLDTGAATNFPSRYYRVRLVP